MKIPKTFTIFGNTVTIKEVEKLDSNDYGYWNDVKNEIVIAHKVRDNEELVKLTSDQIENSFWHELIHCFQWFCGKEYDEVEASSYSNMLMEFIKTSKININPNVINEPVYYTED